MVKYSSKTLDKVFYALSDPTRRALLARLSKGHSPVTELAGPHDMSLPAVSKHLGVLEEAGLITREKDGRVRRCHLQAEPLHIAVDWLTSYRIFWEGKFDALEKFLDQSSDESKS